MELCVWSLSYFLLWLYMYVMLDVVGKQERVVGRTERYVYVLLLRLSGVAMG